ncbi:hypothetical protein ES705_18509 [subsurface metagenome]
MIEKDDLPLIGILRCFAEKDLQSLVEIFNRVKIRFLEITMNTDRAAYLLDLESVLSDQNGYPKIVLI